MRVRPARVLAQRTERSLETSKVVAAQDLRRYSGFRGCLNQASTPRAEPASTRTDQPVSVGVAVTAVAGGVVTGVAATVVVVVGSVVVVVAPVTVNACAT